MNPRVKAHPLRPASGRGRWRDPQPRRSARRLSQPFGTWTFISDAPHDRERVARRSPDDLQGETGRAASDQPLDNVGVDLSAMGDQRRLRLVEAQTARVGVVPALHVLQPLGRRRRSDLSLLVGETAQKLDRRQLNARGDNTRIASEETWFASFTRAGTDDAVYGKASARRRSGFVNAIALQIRESEHATEFVNRTGRAGASPSP
jgi:hypothetical protein